ncbi:MAG: hypothetical protein WBE76_25515 [Terracidiphilus sp.]
MAASPKIIGKPTGAAAPKAKPAKPNDFATQMRVAHEVMRENREVLEKLAK